MCLALPGIVVEKKGSRVIVDYDGLKKDADTSLVDCKVGDYVLVHTGFVIQKVDREAALESLRLWKEALENE